MILLLLRCGLLPEQVEAQRREQGDGVGEQLRRAADAHEQGIDGVVDDGDAEQAEQTRRAERRLPHTGRRTRPYTLPQTMCIAPVPKPRMSR